MNETNKLFLAVLIYETSIGWQCEEPRMFSTSHPEIAYQLAIAIGKEERTGHQFLGLSRLVETEKYVQPITTMQQGDAHKLVVSKAQLEAFNDARWAGKPHNELELQQALAKPPLLMELIGLELIPWEKLQHAYGSAKNIPNDLRRLVSVNEKERGGAIWRLFGSIYHQGTLYTATAYAVPFILRILQNTALPNRGAVAELIAAMAESAGYDKATIQKAWQERVIIKDNIFAPAIADISTIESDYFGVNFSNTAKCLVNNIHILEALAKDENKEVAKYAQAAINFLKKD